MHVLKKQSECLVNTYTTDYFEKMYYFCLKKTGNTVEAEDLASDITINIMSQLYKGAIPVHFSAWVWKIARNRYSVWATKKNRFIGLVSGADVSEFDVADDNTVDEAYISAEEIKLLRRELALISKEYRDILVAFYIDGLKVRDIAVKQNLPEGTIKSKLFRSRNILKEGMNMAREFGTRSYKPENINFASSGSQPSGLPWKAVRRQIPKNILLQAHNNPSSLEELSVELGIAMPYMEEEVSILTDATLLKKLPDGKYITNFFIADKECQMAIYQAQRLDSKERSDALDKMITDNFNKIRALNIMRNDMTDDDFKWLLILDAVDCFITKIKGYDIQCPIKRNDGGDWGFIGFEINDITENIFVGHNGSGDDNVAMVWAYKISNYGLWDRAGEMSYDQVILLSDIIKNKRNISSLTIAERELWNMIDGRFAHAGEDGMVIPDIAVFENGSQQELHKLYEKHPSYAVLLNKYQKAFDETVKILKSYSNPILFEQLNYCASMLIFNVRMMLINDEVESGRLIVPENKDKSTIAMAIHIV